MHENDHHGYASQSLLGVRCCRCQRRRGGWAFTAGGPISYRRTGSLRRQRGRQDGRLGKATSTGSYLDSHPQTNQALTTISQQQAGPQSLAALKTYFDANPQAGKDMQQLQQPLVNLSTRCKLPITVPQILGLLQAAQQGGGLPGGLPGSLPGAQSTGVPGSGLPAQSSPATSTVAGTGPLPGPATVATR